jgi:hypothetical protein
MTRKNGNGRRGKPHKVTLTPAEVARLELRAPQMKDPLMEALHARHVEMIAELERELEAAEIQIEQDARTIARQQRALSRLQPVLTFMNWIERHWSEEKGRRLHARH